MACRAGVKRACKRTSRLREAYRVSAASPRCSSSRCSWPKPFTTRTPVTASSTTPATSPAFCCASQVAGKIDLRIRIETKSKAGRTATITTVSKRRQEDHHDERHEQHDEVADDDRQERQQSLDQRQVRRRPRHELAGLQIVVAREVESLQALEDRDAQVVLHVEADPSTHPPPDVGREERERPRGEQDQQERPHRPRLRHDAVVDDGSFDHGHEPGDGLAGDGHAEGDDHVALVRHEEGPQAAQPTAGTLRSGLGNRAIAGRGGERRRWRSYGSRSSHLGPSAHVRMKSFAEHLESCDRRTALGRLHELEDVVESGGHRALGSFQRRSARCRRLELHAAAVAFDLRAFDPAPRDQAIEDARERRAAHVGLAGQPAGPLGRPGHQREDPQLRQGHRPPRDFSTTRLAMASVRAASGETRSPSDRSVATSLGYLTDLPPRPRQCPLTWAGRCDTPSGIDSMMR